MSIFDNILFKISLFSTSYLLILITVSPMIDHIFTTLDEDMDQKENNFQIFGEIILHVIIITFVWYTINLHVGSYLETIFDLKISVRFGS